MKQSPAAQNLTLGTVNDDGKKEQIADGITPWDILSHIGYSYNRLKQTRATLYQIRNSLVAIYDPHQLNALRDTLVFAIPLTVFSVVEALEALTLLDKKLAPRSQMYQKFVRKWEPYRDDSAHFARRAFLVPTSGRHELREYLDGELRFGASFSYGYETDQFCAGTVPGQRISVVDALHAIRSLYKDTQRVLEQQPHKYPLQSVIDWDISRTIAYQNEILDEDIDADNERDYLFSERYESRAASILEFLKSGPKLEAEVYKATGLPRSITYAVLSRMAGVDKTIRGDRTEAGWLLSVTRKKRNRKVG